MIEGKTVHSAREQELSGWDIDVEDVLPETLHEAVQERPDPGQGEDRGPRKGTVTFGLSNSDFFLISTVQRLPYLY